MDIYFQLGSFVGVAAGWIDGKQGHGNLRGARVALPFGFLLLALGWWGYAGFTHGLTALGSAAVGYAVAFFARRVLGHYV